MYRTAQRWAEENVPPLGALALAIVALSTSAILIRWSDAPSLVKAFYRVVFTVGLLAPLAAFHHRSEMRRLSGRDALIAAVTGLALAVHFAAWFESLEWTSVAASVTLVQSQPLFVVVGAYALLGERLTRAMVGGIVVAVIGIVVMFTPGLVDGTAVGGDALFGNALALLGAVMAAAYVLVGRSLRQRVPLVPYVTVVYGACAVALLGSVMVEGHSLVGYPPREWILFLGMAVGPGILGHTVVNWALAHVESSVVSATLVGEPVGSTLLALALLAEVPAPITLAGGAIVLGGIYLTAREHSPNA